jgi:hypothetical protein
MTKLIYPANISELGKLGVDLYFNKVQNFSKDEAENAFRSAILDLVGATPGGNDFVYKWEQNKFKVFNLISETVTTILPVTIDEELNGFAEVKNANWGDQLIFEVTDPRLFEVGMVSDGNSNIRAQRLDNGKLSLLPQNRAIKVYEEFYRYVSGRIDWAVMVDRVSRSFLNQIKTDIYSKIYNSYANLGATYGVTGSFTDDAFVTLAQHIEAGTGGLKPTVFGTKLALSKVFKDQYYYSGDITGQRNAKGFIPNYLGYDLVEIQQSHTPNTDTFAIDNNFLLFVPAGVNKLVKIGFEGSTIVREAAPTDNADMSIEYTFIQKYDVGVLSAGKYGIYKLS